MPGAQNFANGPSLRDAAARRERGVSIVDFIERAKTTCADLPAERLKMLREAFDKTMKDADFVADAKRSKLDVEPEDGEHLAELIKKIYATPKPIIDKVSELIK